MQAVLVMFRSDGERRSFSIVRDMTVIGRREDCDLRIPLGDVSRKHCRLVRDGDTLRLEDLGSSNGTYHNGQRVDKEAVLGPGDSVQVGPVVFVLQLDGVPADDELHPMTADAAVGAGQEFSAYAPAEAGGEVAEGSEGLEELPAAEAYAEPEGFEGEPAESLESLEPAGDVEVMEGLEPLDGGELEPLEALPEGEPEIVAHGGIEEIHTPGPAAASEPEPEPEPEELIPLDAEPSEPESEALIPLESEHPEPESEALIPLESEPSELGSEELIALEPEPSELELESEALIPLEPEHEAGGVAEAEQGEFDLTEEGRGGDHAPLGSEEELHLEPLDNADLNAEHPHP